MLRTCMTCGRPFKPRHNRHRHCPQHEQRGRLYRSPTTRAQDAEYERERARILANNPPCHWCGKPNADTVDHLDPVSHGGRHRGNLVPACHRCNSSRQNNPHWQPPSERPAGVRLT